MTGKKLQKIISVMTPIIILIILVGFFINNNKYNSTEKVGKITESNFKDGFYNFGDIRVDLTIRSGDSGAWLKDPIYDDDGNMLHGASVGTIYEVVVHNDSDNIVKDWTIKIPINEKMWLNNNWDSEMEVHQDVNGDEKVLAIDLSDYSEYDINLDYYIDHTGPMIPLDKGDYFIYLPEETAKEKPIASDNPDGVRFGYIMYIPDQTVDYVADFSGGEIRYYMYCNPFKQPWFWILSGLLFVWFIILIIEVSVSVKTRKLVEQQEIQNARDDKMIRQTMQLIINMIENKDTNTKGHSLRVAKYARLIAEELGFSEEDCKKVYYIGLLHDCGKVNIPDSILKNPGKLTSDEYNVMKKHTSYGGDILKNFSSIEDIDVGAKFHHERYDGNGYPMGLKGDDIPIVARIIGVADAFDAMNSQRCYRDRLPQDVIMSELESNRGKQFDPKVLDTFLGLIDSGKIEMGV